MTPHGPAEASPWVVRFAALVPAGGVLDVAAGTGRHTRFFRDRGHPVTAIDRDVSSLALDAGTSTVTILRHDLEDGGPWPLVGHAFAAVVVANYLHRPLFPHLLHCVQPGGLLLYETFAAGNERFGRPQHPDHLLRSGELLEVVRGSLDVLAYEHLTIDAPRPAVMQRIAARRSG